MCEISYLIPSYNHGKYIRACLDSIKKDSNSVGLSSEIIIIDDGSTDDSLFHIKSWIADNYGVNCRLVCQENLGISKTINKMNSLASGRYIRLCASDDLLEENSTRYLLDALFDDDTIICAFGDGLVINIENKIVHESSIAFHGGSPGRLLSRGDLAKNLVKRWCVSGPCMLIKRSFFENYQYDEQARIDDIDLFLSIFHKKNSVVFTEKKVCRYRVHGQNTSKTKDVKRRLQNLDSFLYVIDKHLSSRYLDYIRIPLMSLRYKTAAKASFLKKRWGATALYLLLYFFCAAIA